MFFNQARAFAQIDRHPRCIIREVECEVVTVDPCNQVNSQKKHILVGPLAFTRNRPVDQSGPGEALTTVEPNAKTLVMSLQNQFSDRVRVVLENRESIREVQTRSRTS
jgi:hypothetical protein